MRYISFRKRYILPVRYFLQELRVISKAELQDKEDILERIEAYKKSITASQKKKDKVSEEKIKAQIAELEWVIYGKSQD